MLIVSQFKGIDFSLSNVVSILSEEIQAAETSLKGSLRKHEVQLFN